MVASKINLFALSIYLARFAAPFVLLAELYLHIFILAPVVYGVGPSYFIYISVLAFIVMNVIGNVSSFILTDTSVMMDTCMEPELNVKLCTICDRNVPPRCTHCDYCNECIPRRRGHCHLLGTCVGYFNHRYYFVSAIYCLFYSANTVAISIIFYSRVLHNCDNPSTVINQYPIYEDYEDCPLLFSFLLSAFCNFFMLIFTIILLTVETEVVVSGKMRHETDTRNYDRGFKKNLICTLGKHWYLACLCPAVKSTLPDMHAVLFCNSERPMPFAVRF